METIKVKFRESNASLQTPVRMQNTHDHVVIAATAAWDKITGKPSAFPPSEHNHDERYFTQEQVIQAIADHELSPIAHEALFGDKASKADLAQAINEAKEYIDEKISEIAVYEGETEVTPSILSETVLDTTGKLMASDITVTTLPYAEVSNEAGGATAYIGRRVNG